MTGPVVVLFEDEKFRGLRTFLQQALIQDRLSPARFKFETVRGTGGFRKDIALFAARPVLGERPSYVICVGDADRPSQLASGFSLAVNTNDGRRALERQWRRELRLIVSEPAARVHTVVIRWAQESLATTLPEMLMEWADENGASAASCLDAALAGCSDGDPRKCRDFIKYTRPSDCLSMVVKAVSGQNVKFNKGHHNDVFAFRAIMHRQLLFRRHRDFARLYRLLQSLAA